MVDKSKWKFQQAIPGDQAAAAVDRACAMTSREANVVVEIHASFPMEVLMSAVIPVVMIETAGRCYDVRPFGCGNHYH